MPSLPWICERVRRARAITAAAVGRWPEQLVEAVLEAHRQGAALAVSTAPGYALDLVHTFLDLGLTVRHSALGTRGFLVLDQREGWLVGSHLPMARPRLSARALHRAQVAEWVRFRGRIGRIDPRGHAFTIEGFPHVILYGALPGESAIPGALVRVAGLRSLALGQEAYHPHSLQVVEVVPRTRDTALRRLDLAARGASPGAADAAASAWAPILRLRGFADREDLETYLLDHGISRAMVSDVVSAVGAPPPAVVGAVMIMVAGILQARASGRSDALRVCAPILRTLGVDARTASDLTARALRLARDARARERRGPPGPVAPRTGSA